MADKGNTLGKVVGQAPTTSTAPSESNPAVKPETKEEKGWWDSAGDWFSEKGKNVGDWASEQKDNLKEFGNHPVEGVKGIAKGVWNMVPDLGNLAIQVQQFPVVTSIDIGAKLASSNGLNGTAAFLANVSETMNNNNLDFLRLEMSNKAQKGGDLLSFFVPVAPVLKVVSKTGKLAKTVKMVDKTEDIVKTAKEIDKTEDIVKTAKEIDKAEEVAKTAKAEEVAKTAKEIDKAEEIAKTADKGGKVSGKGRNGSLTGRKTKIPPKDSAENIRALTRENEGADILAQHGYHVEQNPLTSGIKNPDYKINGEIFDNIAPTTSSVRNIYDRVLGKVNAGQTNNLVINLADTKVSVSDLQKQFNDWPMIGLDKVIAIDQSGIPIKIK